MYLKIVLFLLIIFNYCNQDLRALAAEEELIPFQEERFSSSQKYLVHIGFESGLPIDGIMKPGERDAALYFSLNGPFPSTPLMEHLDVAPYILIIPYSDPLMSKTLSFHPAEILLGGNLIIDNSCRIIAPRKAKIPAYYDKKNIIRYEGDFYKRNEKAYEVLERLEAFSVSIRLDNGMWTNDSVVEVIYENNNPEEFGEKRSFNINNIDLYPDITSRKISYTCHGCYDDKGPVGISHLSALKGAIYSEKGRDLEKIKDEALKLIEWAQELDHLDIGVKNEFIERVNLLTSKAIDEKPCCVIL